MEIPSMANYTPRLDQGYNNISLIIAVDHEAKLMTRLWATVSGYYMMVVIIIGVTVNGVALNTFRRNKHLLNSNNQLTTCLLGFDTCMLILSFPFICISCLMNRWIFGDFGCQWYGASMTVFGLSSISLLASTAIQRFSSVVLVRRSIASQYAFRRTLKIVISAFLYSLIVASLPFVGIGSYSMEMYVYSCTPTWWARSVNNMIFLSVIVLSGFFLPICVIIVCYSGILIKVYNMPLDSVSRKKQMKLAMMTFCLIASFLLSWGAYAFTALCVMFDEDYKITPLGNIIPVLMAKSCALWNPIIYTCGNKKFRQALSADVKMIVCSFNGRCNVSKNSLPCGIEGGKISTDNDKVESSPVETSKMLQHHNGMCSLYGSKEISKTEVFI